jgi:hypothetical protein
LGHGEGGQAEAGGKDDSSGLHGLFCLIWVEIS